jgi:hypothetical protein
MPLMAVVVICVLCIFTISFLFKRRRDTKRETPSCRRVEARRNKNKENLQFLRVLRKKHAAQAALGGSLKARQS